MTMEEYLRNEIQKELGEKGVVKVEIRELEKEPNKYYRWIVEVIIQHIVMKPKMCIKN